MFNPLGFSPAVAQAIGMICHRCRGSRWQARWNLFALREDSLTQPLARFSLDEPGEL